MNNFVTFYSAPLGVLRIEADETCILSIQRVDSIKSDSPITSNVLRLCIQELDEYFSGKLLKFTTPVRLEGTTFQQDVWGQLLKIPSGKTTTYGEIATLLGDFKKNRAVGMANGQNPIAIIVPCHRVIAKNGDLQGYFYGLDIKRKLLEIENPLS